MKTIKQLSNRLIVLEYTPHFPVCQPVLKFLFGKFLPSPANAMQALPGHPFLEEAPETSAIPRLPGITKGEAVSVASPFVIL